MVLPNRTRLGKRKLEIKEVRKENQTVTSKKHDKRCLENKKSPSEDTFKLQLKTLQDKIDDLEKEKVTAEAAIKDLRSKLKVATSPKSSMDLETQTSVDPGDSESQIPCRICIYVATCEEQLNWHMDDEHDIQTDLYYETDFPCDICGKFCRTEEDLTYHLKKHEFESHSCEPQPVRNENVILECNFCAKKFETKKELMVHKKKEHREKVKVCWNYSSGKCEFVENDCWFLHTNTLNVKLDSKQLTCSSCDETFPVLPELLKHRKKEHTDLIAPCRNILKGACKFGKSKCWFIHDNIENSNESEDTVNLNNENNDVIQKLFKMMETMTERIIQMEESNLGKV